MDTLKTELSNRLESIKDKKEKPSRVKHNFQIQALETAQKLGIELNGRWAGQWFRVFKLAEKRKDVGGKIVGAVSYLSDYQNPITNEGKIKLFFWLVWNK